MHPIFLAALLMAASPDPDGTAIDNPLTDAETLAASGGEIVGAASACPGISAQRLSAATDKVSDLVAAAISDDDELTSAAELFRDHAALGKSAVERGDVDCGRAAASLAGLERTAAEAGPGEGSSQPPSAAEEGGQSPIPAPERRALHRH
jgi:branched-chain amino acid transport system substrate-binding protein